MRLVLALSDEGRRVGESHPRARFSNLTIDTIRDQRDAGMTYGQLARLYGTSRGHIWDICACRTRSVVATKFKTIDFGDGTIVRVSV